MKTIKKFLSPLLAAFLLSFAVSACGGSLLDDGAPGPQGRPGVAGIDGTNGIDGLPGDEGVTVPGSQGTPGNDGQDGVAGIDGEKGDDGEPGPQGPAGPAGPEGTPGDKGNPGDDGNDGQDGNAGIDGIDGLPGDKGEDGSDGIAGPEGPEGPEGPDGPAGPPGDKGDKGNDGDDGSDGNPGIAGPTGPDGPAGPPGDKGDKGNDGDDGSDGNPGIAGPEGPTGPQGDPGDDGDAGPQGVPGNDGQDVDSTVLDDLLNRLRDLESDNAALKEQTELTGSQLRAIILQQQRPPSGITCKVDCVYIGLNGVVFEFTESRLQKTGGNSFDISINDDTVYDGIDKSDPAAEVYVYAKTIDSGLADDYLRFGVWQANLPNADDIGAFSFGAPFNSELPTGGTAAYKGFGVMLMGFFDRILTKNEFTVRFSGNGLNLLSGKMLPLDTSPDKQFEMRYEESVSIGDRFSGALSCVSGACEFNGGGRGEYAAKFYGKAGQGGAPRKLGVTIQTRGLSLDGRTHRNIIGSAGAKLEE